MKYFFFVIMLIVSIMSVSAGGKAELWEYWDQSVEDNTEVIDHSAWQSILDEYRSKNSSDDGASFSYEALVDDGSYSRLDAYITKLENLAVRDYSRSEQFAYWVNMYNAVTVRLILDNYPIASIRKISDPWDKKLLNIEGQAVSLNDIEHRILRPIWNDPRIHFVVNCASIGCPDLPAQALNSINAEAVLENSALTFINSEKGIKRSGNRLVLSSIFDWYLVDFGGNETALRAYLGKYRDLPELNTMKLKYDYDWDLNE